MIVILNFAPAPQISEEQLQSITQSVSDRMDSRYRPEKIATRVCEIPQFSSLPETIEAVGLTEAQWLSYAVIPRISDDHPYAAELLMAVNRKRGYTTPIIRQITHTGKEVRIEA